MRKLFLVLLALVGILICGLAVLSCVSTATSKVKVVTSTSLLGYIAEQVGGDKVEVINLIPPAQHPGNFNVRPGDIETLSKAKLFLVHGWPGEGYVDKMVASAGNPSLTVFKASITGSWMTPSVQSEAATKVATKLGELDSANSAIYLKNAEAYKQRMSALEMEIKTKLLKLETATINVVCAGMQADFVKWAGFKVVATYPDPNALNPQLVRELVDKGKAAGVKLVVDNLQNGKDAGKSVAEEMGSAQVTLSNFPGGFENTETFEKAINRNLALLEQALKK